MVYSVCIHDSQTHAALIHYEQSYVRHLDYGGRNITNKQRIFSNSTGVHFRGFGWELAIVGNWTSTVAS